MKKTIALSILALTLCLNSSLVIAAPNYSYSTGHNSYNQNQLQGSVTYIPQGTSASVILDNSLNSETISVGQPVSAVLSRDFIYNNQIIAPEGSTISGSVTIAKKAGMGNRNAQIQVIFNNIMTPYGTSIPIRAVIKTDDNSGILKGGTAKDATVDYAKNAVIGAGLGAALGTAMGAMSGGSVGKGAIYGTALGGGMGVAKGAASKGGDVMIPQGAGFDIILIQPATISNNAFGY